MTYVRDPYTKRLIAFARSQRLLRQFLSPEDWERYENGTFIEVTGSLGGKYWIYANGTVGGHCVFPFYWTGTQELIVTGAGTHKIVRHKFKPDLPVPDLILWAKLWIEADEAAVLNYSNSNRFMEPVS